MTVCGWRAVVMMVQASRGKSMMEKLFKATRR